MPSFSQPVSAQTPCATPTPIPDVRAVAPAEDEMLLVEGDRYLVTVAPPDDWPAFEMIPDQGQIASHPSDDLTIRIEQQAADIDNTRLFLIDAYGATTIETVLHENRLVLVFTYSRSQDNIVYAGRGFAVNADLTAPLTVVTVETGATDDPTEQRLNTVYRALIDSLRFVRISSDSSRLLDQPLRLYDVPMLDGVMLAYPQCWQDFAYDSEGDWYASFSETGDTAIYVRIIPNPGDIFDQIAGLLPPKTNWTVNTLQDTLLDGYNALAFTYNYKFNDDWIGEAVAVQLSNTLLIVSVDHVEAIGSVTPFYQMIRDSITLPDSDS